MLQEAPKLNKVDKCAKEIKKCLDPLLFKPELGSSSPEITTIHVVCNRLTVMST